MSIRTSTDTTTQLNTIATGDDTICKELMAQADAVRQSVMKRESPSMTPRAAETDLSQANLYVWIHENLLNNDNEFKQSVISKLKEIYARGASLNPVLQTEVTPISLPRLSPSSQLVVSTTPSLLDRS